MQVAAKETSAPHGNITSSAVEKLLQEAEVRLSSKEPAKNLSVVPKTAQPASTTETERVQQKSPAPAKEELSLRIPQLKPKKAKVRS